MCPVYFYKKGRDFYNEKAENAEGNRAYIRGRLQQVSRELQAEKSEGGNNKPLMMTKKIPNGRLI